jgi:hypothetical protein
MSERAVGVAPTLSARRRRWESLAVVAAAVALSAYCIGRYRDAVLSFFFLDDFWLLRDVSGLHWTGPLDVAQVFRPTHAGFKLWWCPNLRIRASGLLEAKVRVAAWAALHSGTVRDTASMLGRRRRDSPLPFLR